MIAMHRPPPAPSITMMLLLETEFDFAVEKKIKICKRARQMSNNVAAVRGERSMGADVRGDTDLREQRCIGSTCRGPLTLYVQIFSHFILPALQCSSLVLDNQQSNSVYEHLETRRTIFSPPTLSHRADCYKVTAVIIITWT